MLSYGDVATSNNYEFPPTYTLSFNTKPVMSDNGVTAKYNRNELTVNWVVAYDTMFYGFNPPAAPSGGASPQSVDTLVQRIRSILMRPQLELRCEYQGLGPAGSAVSYGLTINSTNDVNFGPVPLEFKWRNLASQRCVELSWTVAFHTHNQIIYDGTNTITALPTIFSELSWSRSYEIDEIGSVTVTTTGKYSLNSNVPSHSDSYRIVAAFPVPLYCQRVSQRFQNDPTSKSTTFTIVDKQHPTENALPPKCIKMDLTHEVSSSLFGGGKLEGKGFHQWSNVIQGSITLPPGEPFAYAYLLFWFYARQRLYRTNTGAVGEGIAYQFAQAEDEKENIKVLKTRNIITKISYKESLFDRTHSFRLEYAGTYEMRKLLQQSGLFTPLYNYKVDQSGQYKYWYQDTNSSNDREPWHIAFPRPSSPTSPTDAATLANQWNQYRTQFGPNHPNYNYLPTSAWNVYGYTGFNENDVGPWVFYPTYQSLDQVKINNAGPAIPLPGWVYDIDNRVDYNEQTKILPETKQAGVVDVDPVASYLAHENTFSIMEDVNTYQIPRQKCDSNIDLSMKSYLGNQGGVATQTKASTNVALHNAQIASPGQQPATSDYVRSYNSQPITRIVMSGYSVRAGYPPVIPCAFSYKNSSLYRTGQSNVTVKQLAQGPMPIYLATWTIPYYANTSVHSNFFADLNALGLSGDLT